MTETNAPADGDSVDRENADHGNRDRLPGRRTYLKALGAAGIGQGLFGFVGRAAAADYRTYEVDAGETLDRRLGDGDRFENVLIDLRADGASADIRAAGKNWAIKNVGVLGTYSKANQGSIFTLRTDEGTTGIVEDVYLGDGAIEGGHAAVFVPTEHAGKIVMKRCYVAGWPDNGIYASAPGRAERNGQGGNVRVVDSYMANNNVSGVRLGSDGSAVRSSVIVVDEDVPANAAGKTHPRGVWAKEGGNVLVKRCDISVASESGSEAIRQSDGSGRARVRGSSITASGETDRFRGTIETNGVDDDPDLTPPSGVPESAEDAVGSGTSHDDSAAGSSENDESVGKRTVRFSGGDSDNGEYLEYSLASSDGLSGRGGSTDNGESPSGGQAEGSTGGSRDAYTLTGSIESLDAELVGAEVDARVRIERNGEGGRATFAGGTSDERLEYKLETTGSIDPTDSIEEGSRAASMPVRGGTGGSSDELAFTGEISLLRVALPDDGDTLLVKIQAI